MIAWYWAVVALIAGALFGNSSLVHYDDLIGVCYGVQPMCDDKHCLIPTQFRHCLLYAAFIIGINAGGRFIQNDDRRILQDTSRNRDPLCLTA